MKIYEFDPVIYPLKLWIHIGKDKSVLDDRFDEVADLSKKSYAHVESCYDKVNDANGYLMWFDAEALVFSDIIAHESAHVAFKLMADIGSEANSDSDEPFCYFLGWVVRCVNEVKESYEEHNKKDV